MAEETQHHPQPHDVPWSLQGLGDCTASIPHRAPLHLEEGQLA